MEPLFENLKFLDVLKPGAEGAVFKCCSVKDGKEVLLKIYGPDRPIRRTELEISKLLTARSPYLCHLISSGKKSVRSRDCRYLITDYINGTNLADFLNSGEKLNNDQAEKLVLHIAHAVQALWNVKVVHSDIKPDNIILSSTGEFILIDLGVAKHLDAEQITEITVLCFGTNGYLAPEQFTGRKNLTLRADFYAVGITAWQAIVGYHPFGYNQALMKQPLPPFPEGIIIKPNLAGAIRNLSNPVVYRRPVSYAVIAKEIKGDK